MSLADAMKSRQTDRGYILRLDRGEEILTSVTAFAKAEKIEAAFVTGIGAVKDVTLGIFQRDKKEYSQKAFDGEYELLSLDGNLSMVDGEQFTHLHCVLSGNDYVAFGGHLFGATVAVTGELRVVPLGGRLERRLNPEIGLKLLDV